MTVSLTEVQEVSRELRSHIGHYVRKGFYDFFLATSEGNGQCELHIMSAERCYTLTIASDCRKFQQSVNSLIDSLNKIYCQFKRPYYHLLVTDTTKGHVRLTIVIGICKVSFEVSAVKKEEGYHDEIHINHL